VIFETLSLYLLFMRLYMLSFQNVTTITPLRPKGSH